MTKTILKPKPKLIIKNNRAALYDIIIIGGGPAGLTAALYAVRARLKVLMIEKMILGGMASTTSHIENYPGFPEGVSGMELSNRMQDQVRRLGLDVVWANAVKLENKKDQRIVVADDKTYAAQAIIIATGTKAQKLGVPGEEEFRGRGVSYCATCDGAFYKNKKVIVVGGGNSAIEEALFLTRYASKVSLVHRRDQLRADKIIAERAIANPKVYFFWHSTVERIIGQDKVTEIVLNDLHDKKKLKVSADGVFVYIGSSANTEFVNKLIDLDKKGFIKTDEEMRTSAKGIFAAGDVRAKTLRQIVTATSDGAIAAESARKFIEDHQ